MEEHVNTFRFVVCIDAPGETLADAYRRLLKELANTSFGDGGDGGGWESGDEAYDPDGESIDPKILADTKCAVLSEAT